MHNASVSGQLSDPRVCHVIKLSWLVSRYFFFVWDLWHILHAVETTNPPTSQLAHRSLKWSEARSLVKANCLRIVHATCADLHAANSTFAHKSGSIWRRNLPIPSCAFDYSM